jgi:hypothetical protein
VFNGKVTEQGTLELRDDQAGARQRWLWTLKGQDVEVVVRKLKVKRSNKQNRLWWSLVIRPITAACEMDPNSKQDCELVHYGLVEKCFGTQFNEALDLELPKVRSSTLSVQEFTYLIEWTARWAAEELGLYLEMPEDLLPAKPMKRTA